MTTKFYEIIVGVVLALIGLGLIVLSHPKDGEAAEAPDILVEIRCCAIPGRNADGSIKRSDAVRAAFKRANPCPSTHSATGPCPGYIMDHPIPLACGGIDAVWNLQWLSYDLWMLKSKEERKSYGGRGISPGCP